jgi:hypothetical protein
METDKHQRTNTNSVNYSNIHVNRHIEDFKPQLENRSHVSNNKQIQKKIRTQNLK